MGALPNWSVGSAPSPGRQVSARDINDLRGWVDAVDPTRALNGLHWMSPVTLDSADSRTQVNAGGGFGSVLILSPKDSTGSWSSGMDPTATQIYWLERNRTCSPPGLPFYEAVVVRLLHGPGSLPGFPNDPAQLAALWGPFIRWCQGQGVFNFVVLNEPDIEYPNLLWPVTSDAQNYMSGLTDAIRAQGVSGQNLWLGFPGPSGNLPAGSASWNQYWTGYQQAIKGKYNNVTAHIYGPSDTSLINTAGTVYGNLRNWFPNFPIRYTEYGIPLNAVPGMNRSTRASMYANFVRWVHNNQPEVFACYVFIAGSSPDFDCGHSRDCPDPQGHPQNCCYMLQDSEAQALAQQVGCLGQS